MGLLVSQSEVSRSSLGKLALVVGKSGLRVQPLRLGGHWESAPSTAARPQGSRSSLKGPVRHPVADLYKVDDL